MRNLWMQEQNRGMGPNSTGMNLYCIELGDDSNRALRKFLEEVDPGRSLFITEYTKWCLVA